ncbi:WD40 repeat-like protein [Guyanagaster necrorhizus]|uniref:WD40 repeat-like protein n=1 Tax=Guyanagaster necrorhizus TaxID=856835 RepID=A0A9P7VX98_9AGAR|nr:WD40 repeat-like protein [Guyanagaster necrorhizus MCA 3950]KAG7448140.1 WD40 repeat-like protein [Guyanagaster necrorhizus MCA 3950]
MESESTFVAPEGVYSIIEEHKPFFLTHVNTPSSPFPTRVSTIVVRYPPAKHNGNGPGFAQLLSVGNKDRDMRNVKNKGREDGHSQSSSDTGDDDGSPPPGGADLSVSSTIPHEHHALFSHSGPAKKKHVGRPKHNVRTTSSTFITRAEVPKALQAKQGDTVFLFYNTGKSFLWVETGSKSKEPLARVTFSAFPTCHDVNTLTASPECLDVIIGFSTGDLIWLDPISSRYSRLNKQGCISNSPCTAVRWVPSSSTLFLASHADGTIVVYDRERDDGTFKPQEPIAQSGSSGSGSLPSSDDSTSQKDWDPMDNIFVTIPPWHPVTGGAGLKNEREREKAVKNPVSHWKISKKSVVDFTFSPDVKYVGAISEDGCLRVIDALAEQLVDCYASYFGALTCVAWSPDGKFILTGGQDDLLTIFSPWEQRVIARCQGHSSFVTAVAFDELRCDGRTYRFGSVGEDNKLILWDFSSGALHRPKFQATHHQRVSMSSTISLAFKRDRSALYLPSPTTEDKPYPRYHPAPSRNEIAVVQPVLVKHVEGELLADVAFLPRSLMTATKIGHVKLWIRPLALRPRHLKPHRTRTISIDVDQA